MQILHIKYIHFIKDKTRNSKSTLTMPKKKSTSLSYVSIKPTVEEVTALIPINLILIGLSSEPEISYTRSYKGIHMTQHQLKKQSKEASLVEVFFCRTC
jgi:hypothetical protein